MTKRPQRIGWACISPALLFLCAFGLGPMAYAFYMSLHEARSGDYSYIGNEHFRQALTSSAFWNSFETTIYYAAGVVPVSMAIGLFFSLLLYRLPRFQGLLRTIFFLPYVTSLVAAAMVWRVLFEPRQGPVNFILESIGLPAQQWLQEPRGLLHLITGGADSATGGMIPADWGPSLALCCIILFEIWRNTGFVIVLCLAGLSAVSRELEESAQLDGADAWHVNRHVRIPALRPILVFLFVVGMIQAFQAFSSIYALTGNGRGPLNTTQNLTVYIYSNFYEFQNAEYGAAVAVLLCLIVVALTWFQWRILERREEAV